MSTDQKLEQMAYAFVTKMEQKYNAIELANMPTIIMEEAYKAGYTRRDAELKAVEVEFDAEAVLEYIRYMPNCTAGRLAMETARFQFEKDRAALRHWQVMVHAKDELLKSQGQEIEETQRELGKSLEIAYAEVRAKDAEIQALKEELESYKLGSRGFP